MRFFASESFENIRNLALPVVLILFCAMLMIWVTWFVNTKVPDARVEPPDAPRAHTIVIIDQTDVLSERCMTQLDMLLQELPQTVKKGEMLSIFAISANSDLAVTPLLSVYNPGLGSNEWVENLRMKRKQFMDSFWTPIVNFSKELKQRPPSPTSPIVETVNRILKWKKFSALTPKRVMVIYSDMLQNSMNCSDYPTSTIVYEGAPGCPELRPMEGVRVDIRYIVRPKLHLLQTPEHQQRWREMFEKAGADVTIERTI